jgi:hypothetical protein
VTGKPGQVGQGHELLWDVTLDSTKLSFCFFGFGCVEPHYLNYITIRRRAEDLVTPNVPSFLYGNGPEEEKAKNRSESNTSKYLCTGEGTLRFGCFSQQVGS